MEKDMTYTTERYTAEVDAKSYIEGFRNADYFVTLCQQCRNYGRRHGCPPFDDDPLLTLCRYDSVRLLGVKIIPTDKTLPLDAANGLMLPVITAMNAELLAMEKELDGRCYGFVGACPYCGGAPCARIDGQPCRHPEKVRPSLEAVGFDISKTAKELLGLEIKWGRDGRLPEYLTLVCGIFYNLRSDGLKVASSTVFH